ncbi:MAG: putative peptidase [Candidatus Anoxychlamydiales bacterium]|nr:putative peptidase [Candidatus Anoxychlamydiales bacterium]NGX36107.1 putative peptidase [Candidatus Anoxychlamydiales bacterium]
MNYSKRIINLQKCLMQKNMDLLILDDPISLIYLTGLKLSSGKIFILKDKAKLFVDGRYIQAAKEKTDIDVELIGEKVLMDFIVQNNIKNIGFDSSITTYHSFERLKSFLKKIKNAHDHSIELIPVLSPLKELRVIKDLDEIAVLKKAASLTWKGFEHICLHLKEGMSEKEVALEFEMFVKKNGADALSFNSIVCFGKNSAMPHHMPSDTKLKLNDIVLMDLGVTVDNYNSDMTRVVFFGKPDPTLEKIYSINKKAHANALSVCRPGHKLKDLDIAAREVLRKEGYEKEFVHSLGHGVGLEIHEFPRVKFDTEDKDVILKPGMVITIEPGIYIPDLGGVRYEDMIVITNDGYENFYR